MTQPVETPVVETPAAPVDAAPVVEATPDTPAAPVDGSATLDIDDISSMLNFDPFDEANAAPDTPQASDAPTAEVPAAPVVDEPATPDVQTVPETPVESPEMVLLRQQVELLQTQLTATQAAPAQPSAEAQADPLAGMIPNYMFQIPDQLSSLLDSEDANERKTGIQHLLNGALTQVHRNVLEQVQGVMTTYVPQQLQQHTQQNALTQQINGDFYGANADLNTPETRQLVSMLVGPTMQEVGATTWTPQLRDILAAKVRGMLGKQAVPVVPAVPAQVPPVQFGQGTRAPIPANQNVQQDIMNTLF